MSAPNNEQIYVKWFKDLSMKDVRLVGGKNASLGEMVKELSSVGVNVPDGFAITANAYRRILDENDAWTELHSLLDNLDKTNVDELARVAHRAREIVFGARCLLTSRNNFARRGGPWKPLKVKS